MSSESSLDVPYRLTPHLASSIHSAESMLVSSADGPIEIPLELFQVLMMFAETRTAREVFDALEVDVTVDEFVHIVGGFHARGLLQPARVDDDGPDLRAWLDPEIFGDPARVASIADRLRDGRAIVVPAALRPELADDVHGELQRTTQWRVAEGGHDFFHFRSCNLERIAGRGAALTRCSELFGSAATRRFIAELSGEDCGGAAQVAASWYRPGEYALPHNDLVIDHARSVAFIWYLTRDWRQDWGGALFWCPSGQYLLPAFNVLIVFRVMPANMHLVCPVAPGATSRRLAVNGFWHRAQPGAVVEPIAEDAVISPRLCGPDGAVAASLSPVIAL
jgi:hypothetical protein